MKKFLAPLLVFAGSNIVLLIAFVFMGAIGTAGDALATSTTETGSYIWGWPWIVGGTRLWVWLFFELLILWGTAKAFLAMRH